MSIARYARPAAVAAALALALALSAVVLLVVNTRTQGQAQTAVLQAQTVDSIRTNAKTGGPPVGIKHLNVSGSRLLSVSSQNWAGYVASDNRFRYVQATFAVPSLNCRKTPGTAKTPAMVGVWVGLDGLGGGKVTVEQDGIAGWCVRGVPSYAAWWETYPKPPVYPRMTIHPGDVIEVSVYYNSGKRQYRLNLTDRRNGEGFGLWRRCGASSCRNASAEVISESPSVSVSGNKLFPLADFGTESFSRIQVTDAAGQRGGFGSSLWSDTELVMTDSSGHVKATTSGLSHGTAFQNRWERTS